MPFAYKKILQNLHLIGSPKAELRMAKAKAGPVVSDNGNFIIDAPFPEELMRDPYTVRVTATAGSETLTLRAAAVDAHQDAHGHR